MAELVEVVMKGAGWSDIGAVETRAADMIVTLNFAAGKGRGGNGGRQGMGGMAWTYMKLSKR